MNPAVGLAANPSCLTYPCTSPSTQESAKLTALGLQGPEGGGKGYSRVRTVIIELSGGDVDAMFDAYERGGDSAVTDWLQQHHSANYVLGWTFVR